MPNFMKAMGNNKELAEDEGAPPPLTEDDHADVLVAFALQLQRLTTEMGLRHAAEWSGAKAVQLRIGIHSGPIAAAVLGTQQLSYQTFGQTNRIAEQCEKHGLPGRVVVSEVTAELLRRVSVEKGTTSLGTVCDERSPDDKKTHYELFAVKESVIDIRNVLGTKVASMFLQDDENLVSETASRRSKQTKRTNRSSVGVKQHKDSEQELERQKRKEFIARQAKKAQKKLGDGDGEGNSKATTMLKKLQGTTSTTDEEEEEDGERPNCCRTCLSMAFADPDVEAQYVTFVLEKMFRLRLTMYLCFPVLMALIYLLVFLEGVTLNWEFHVFLLVGVLFGSVSSVICFVQKGQWYHVETVLVHVEVLLYAVAYALVNRRQFSAVVTNDCYYLYGIFTVYGTLTNSCLYPPMVTALGNFFVMYLPLVLINAFIPESISLINGAVFLFICFIAVVFVIQIQQRLARQQFLEMWVAQYYHQEAQEQVRAQEGLLLSMVPKHVVQPLMLWIDSGLDSEKAIAIPYSRLCISFFDFSSSRASGVYDSLEWLSTGEEMCALHSAIDQLMARFRSIVKIKCIGEIIMAAGPFSVDETAGVTSEDDRVRQCAVEMLQVAGFCKLGEIERSIEEHYNKEKCASTNQSGQKIVPKIKEKFRAGLHVGPVMAAVLGTARLSFDVFGDSVNTASRAMTTASKPGRITVSSGFLSEGLGVNAGANQVASPPNTVQEEGSEGSKDVEFLDVDGVCRLGPPIRRAAKGKDHLIVREVEEFTCV